ncbi:glycosyltransferase [Candidatus Woesearchaeota archaeon]|nr:glycosyltransferase [Candidatus Woesearchaeota archaeon]
MHINILKILKELEIHKLDTDSSIEWQDEKRKKQIRELIESLEELIKEGEVSSIDLKQCENLILFLRKVQEAYKGDKKANGWISQFPSVKTVYEIDSKIDTIVHNLHSKLKHLPSITIVISMYNSKQSVIDITRALLFDSIIKNVPSDVEIILIDDNSPLRKETDLIVRELMSKRNIVFIRNSLNLGFSGSYNIGLRRARGDIVFMANSDIRITPGSIESISEVMRYHPGCGIIGCIFSDTMGYKPQFSPYKLESLTQEEISKLDAFAQKFRKTHNGSRVVNWVIGSFLEFIEM